MHWILRHKWLMTALPAAIVIVLLAVQVWKSGDLRSLNAVTVSEARLARRGEALTPFRLTVKDRMIQMYVAAGEFQMGSTKGKRSSSGNATQHSIYLDSYWIDEIDVTNAMYAMCQRDGACRPPARYDTYYADPGYADYPVVWVNWYNAQAFCAWAGERLPTEAEWEKAARGTDGRIYPWGNDPPDNSMVNFNGTVGEPMSVYEHLTNISPYGLVDMSGNVQDWVLDWYDPHYYSVSPYKNPQGPATGELKILRGGGYWSNATEIQSFYRKPHDPRSAGQMRGIRCAQDAEK